jgi:hypothetical protein
MGTDTSLGRKLDGDATWVSFIVTTPDASNNQGIYIVGIEEESAMNNHFSLYPNPTRGIVQCSKKSNIRVYSIHGNLIETLNGVWQINFSNYSAGIYLVSDEQGNKIRVMKE